MTSSYTFSTTQSFTVTHAKHLASKVATDLKRIQRLYEGSISDAAIDAYEAELVELLKNGYLSEVIYGYKRNGNWIEPTLRYSARDLVIGNSDDDPGRIRPGADVSGASFSSFLKYSASYLALPNAQKIEFGKSLPFQRTSADEPGVNGYFASDKSYSSGGKALDRSTVKSY